MEEMNVNPEFLVRIEAALDQIRPYLQADGGAPPDYFNWQGQNWAAPRYNWEKMKTDGFAWFDRLSHMTAGSNQFG